MYMYIAKSINSKPTGTGMVHGIRISQKVLLPCVFKSMCTVAVVRIMDQW